ncbi:MAG TPA: hypothetical protein VN408_42535 [Actinoplanes sp.]|nr:hypothetical protein [Actinoplanes sp.]
MKMTTTLLALVTVLSLAGCEGSKPPPSAEDTAKLRQYADCMKEYGIDIPVPGEGEPAGGLVTIGTGVKALAARTACARLEPEAHAQGKPDPADEERALRLAACLRTEGIKAVDPRAGEINVGLEDGATYSQQELIAAFTTCGEQVGPR